MRHRSIESFRAMLACDRGNALVEYAVVMSVFSISIIPAMINFVSGVSTIANHQMGSSSGTGYLNLISNPSWSGAVNNGSGGQYCNSRFVRDCP